MNKFSYARYTEAQDFDGAIPSAHDLGGFKAVMNELKRTGMIQAVAELAADIKEISDRKPFLAGEHRRNAVALHVIHCGAKLAVNFPGAIDLSDIWAAQNFGVFGLGK